ncbi:hypothetical protein EN836_26690 [Mesorhizobium sp. M1C.F.Ca.ET.193.01.1.1]|uniref:hypothetical protein n=1 Tax=unclassified Mesorhizobium TaxID=325217 RepID=UPI000FD36F27|nr:MULTISPECIES: hypothetical protein [unclassified Mesorhizobium]TGS93897.1 hypothetical protein EN820_47355 [bacterium M00.F.Ca.ET.177.01.1.1]TGQ50962.1 hypothetical protein EN853_26685 [Mesorhizobium sp. M1C.F.Ca.ET.210.01.1.1]TGQ66399.1 hypothetical protein EN855_026695 [Mesorhizobium sp. M1C.F.Ca.ET.212.01.1.1]TGR00485.1 hypothetical protein EN847_26685 [Mesorhizobium sp. M1C.F.Ca.ET.204.01.1.1]TGR21076.1 hypothetical protein EN839_26685 [Mesorhizobium sp. M1C.F.Ca.ET.196.01.1.1]
MNAAITMNAKNRKRPADTSRAGCALALIELIETKSATRAPPAATIDRFNARSRPSQKKSELDGARNLDDDAQNQGCWQFRKVGVIEGARRIATSGFFRCVFVGVRRLGVNHPRLQLLLGVRLALRARLEIVVAAAAIGAAFGGRVGVEHRGHSQECTKKGPMAAIA